MGPIGSAVLTFIGYKRTDKQTDRQAKLIYRFDSGIIKKTIIRNRIHSRGWIKVEKDLFCIFPINFSRDIAFPIFPAIFSLPVIKAVVGFNFPLNILPKSADFRVKVTSASPAG